MRAIQLPVIAILFGVTSTAWESRVAADDLADLQRKWGMTITANGIERRVIKTIEGTSETLEVYEDTKLIQKHIVDFELKSYGPAKVFTWKNGRIVAGPRAGQKSPDGRFIYRLEKLKWIGVHGMLDGDQTEVLREVYERLTPRPDPAA